MTTLSRPAFSTLSVLFLGACLGPGSVPGEDNTAPLIFWSVAGAEALGDLSLSLPRGSYAHAVRVADDGPGESGVVSVAVMGGHGYPSYCDWVAGDVGTSTGGGLGSTVAEFAQSDSPTDEWRYDQTITVEHQMICPEGQYGTAGSLRYSARAVDAAGNVRESHVVITADPLTGRAGSDVVLDNEGESCGLDTVIWMADGAPVFQNKGEQKTFLVDTKDVYWYCTNRADYNYEVTRCPAGTELLSVTRDADGEMSVDCLQRP